MRVIGKTDDCLHGNGRRARKYPLMAVNYKNLFCWGSVLRCGVAILTVFMWMIGGGWSFVMLMVLDLVKYSRKCGEWKGRWFIITFLSVLFLWIGQGMGRSNPLTCFELIILLIINKKIKLLFEEVVNNSWADNSKVDKGRLANITLLNYFFKGDSTTFLQILLLW